MGVWSGNTAPGPVGTGQEGLAMMGSDGVGPGWGVDVGSSAFQRCHGSERVMIDGLVQHQTKHAHTVGHGLSHIPLLLKQLVQLHPLQGDRQPAVSRQTLL